MLCAHVIKCRIAAMLCITKSKVCIGLICAPFLVKGNLFSGNRFGHVDFVLEKKKSTQLFVCKNCLATAGLLGKGVPLSESLKIIRMGRRSILLGKPENYML